MIIICIVCTSCPGSETLAVFLQNELDDMTIEYKTWVVIDKATLMTLTHQSDKFIKSLVSKTPELTDHHYNAKQQARDLKHSKENLQSEPAVLAHHHRELAVLENLWRRVTFNR
jgi:hypothetical protein